MKKKNLEEAEFKLNKRHNNTIKMTNYRIMNDQANFECLICGYNWSTTPHSVINGGTGCNNCASKLKGIKLRLDFNYVFNYIKSKNCELISKEYNRSNDRLSIRFECEHIRKMTFTDFKAGKRCKPCSMKTMGIRMVTSDQKIFDILEKNNLHFISFPNGHLGNISKIEYICEEGHYSIKSISKVFVSPTCKKCNRIKQSKNQIGRKSLTWKGGRSKLHTFLRREIGEWKKLSMKNCNYKCVITGDNFNDIHHLFSLSKIIELALIKLNLNDYNYSGNYTDNQLYSIAEEVKKIHLEYPLGVCLRKDVHKLFHLIYGKNDVCPKQFEEFKQKIDSGEITI
jgi:hypothetical protein